MTTPDDESAVRAVIDRWAAAFRTKSVDDAAAVHDPATISYDIVPPLAFTGWEHYQSAWTAAFDGFGGPITVEPHDVTVVVGGDVAYAHCLNHFQGTAISANGGGQSDYWFRWTACLRRLNGEWRITHDHASLPTDFASGRSVQDLVPDSRPADHGTTFRLNGTVHRGGTRRRLSPRDARRLLPAGSTDTAVAGARGEERAVEPG